MLLSSKMIRLPNKWINNKVEWKTLFSLNKQWDRKEFWLLLFPGDTDEAILMQCPRPWESGSYDNNGDFSLPINLETCVQNIERVSVKLNRRATYIGKKKNILAKALMILESMMVLCQLVDLMYRMTKHR